MKINIFKLAAIMLVLTGTLSSCGDKNEGEEPVTIIGKWKLVKVMEFTGKIHDYSARNVVYEFKANGVLTISEGEHIVEYSYSIIEQSNYSTIKIRNVNFPFSISSEELVLFPPYLGPAIDCGQKYFFVKVN